LTETGSATTSTISFNKAGTQIFTSGGTINNDVNFVVNNGSTLQMAAAATIVGGNNFTLSSGATLGIRSTAGITSAGATGNVQSTGTRSFSTTANYIYNGSANQSAGNGLPGTVSNLTIANTGGGGNNTVTLVNNVGITNALTVNSGVLAMGANNITTVGSVNMTGTSITGTGTLTLAGNVTTNASPTASTISAPISLGGSSRTFDVDDTAAIPDLNLTGAISGAGGIIKTGIGSMNLANAGNSYGGSTTANQGILRIAAFGGTIPNGSALIINSTLDLNGNSETVGSLAGSGTVTSNAGTTMTLTAGGDNTSTNFSGVIQNGSSTGVSLSKTGTGALSLSGNNTYSGATSLLGGTLNMNSATLLALAL
jgi:autotransporter-associated beta strand protein